MGLNQLKNLPKNASAIVLITDGANNAGEISPEQAAEAAKALGIRVHTVGLSSADTFSVALNGVWTVRNVNARLSGRDEAVLKMWRPGPAASSTRRPTRRCSPRS